MKGLTWSEYDEPENSGFFPPHPGPLPRRKRVQLENQLRGERGQSQENPQPRFRALAVERNGLEAPASSGNPGRQEPPEQRVPRLEPRNKDINPHRAMYNHGLQEFS